MTQTAASALTVLDHPDGERDLIGLARVSTDAQDAQLQQHALALAGCGRAYVEKVSTRKAATERKSGARCGGQHHLAGDACILDRLSGCWLNLPMATVWLRLRADVRLRWRALAGLALLLGIIGGVVLTAAAGARRTDTAYPRLLSWANASQVDVLPEGTGPTGYFTALARLPQIAAMATEVLYQVEPPGAPRRSGAGGDLL